MDVHSAGAIMAHDVADAERSRRGPRSALHKSQLFGRASPVTCRLGGEDLRRLFIALLLIGTIGAVGVVVLGA